MILLERAEVEEKGYNWAEAAKLYEQVVKAFLDKKMVREAAGAYKKLGYAWYRTGRTAETAEEYVEQNRRAVEAYKEAANLFAQSGNRADELECKAESLFASGSIAGSVAEGKKAFSKSFELFIESCEHYSKKGDRESRGRTLSRAAWTSGLLVTYCSDRLESEQFVRKGRDAAVKTWELSKEIGNIQSIAESLAAEWVLFCFEMYTVFFRDDHWMEYIRKLLSRCDESLKIAEDCDDPSILGMIYLGLGGWSCFFGFHFAEDEREQSEYVDKGLGFLEKALVFARKAKDNETILWSLYWLDWWPIYAGRFEYIQKRILYDLGEFEKLEKLFVGTYGPPYRHFFAHFLPAVCYTNFALMRFFPLDQRKSFAEKGIEHAKESLMRFSFSPLSAWAYQVLTWSHSQLAALAAAKEERNEHTQKMFQYAKQAAKVAEKYEGGFVRAAGYSSLYRAHKTLADIVDNEEERIKMLTAAADASKKYIRHPVESRTGIIAAQMRLGLLYEELGILTMKTDSLRKARETFRNVIKESQEKGYHFYAAAAHISAANIEDRLGNHVASAEHYERAVDAYKESMKTIEYKPLKDRVKEKINYSGAWNLIERAKIYHKREDHQQAKENYEKACEILKQLPSYNYEAPYYSAWASQEEAEQLSNQERHAEALEKYETARKGFENAIKTLERASKQSTEKRERERIERLGNLAKVRMSYCSAGANVERARIKGKRGEHVEAAEIFASAASQFREVTTLLEIERERGELEAVYYLCRAWESMELAEEYEDHDRFAEAANLFTKASKFFTGSKLKLLASGNSAFCQALEHGCRFDESTDRQVKAQLYQKVKMMLRKAASSYRKGGFQSGDDWALATSTYFDAAWHLIRADEELNLDKRRKLLGIGSRYLKSAAELFGKASHRDKEREVLERQDRVEKEEKILLSALNTIREPAISRSTVGIVAPASPLETSLSPRISEVRMFTEEAARTSHISTGYEELDSLLFGGIPTSYAVILTSPSCDERDLLIRGFLEAGAKRGEITFYVTTKTSGLKNLAEGFQSNFYLFVCNPQADKVIKDLPNVFKLKGVENLTDISIALSSTCRKLESLTGPRRACIEIVSDILLQHHAVHTRRWLNALIPELKSKGFTTLAVTDPGMHSPQEVRALLDLFEGEISIKQRGTAKLLKVKKMTNQEYSKSELVL